MAIIFTTSRTFLPALPVFISLAILSLLCLEGYIDQTSSAVSFDSLFPEPVLPLQDDVTVALTDTPNPPPPPPHILIVSALFPLSKSKHSMDDYHFWLSHFLGPITTDIYFFTTPALEPLVRAIRKDLPITINTTFSSPFDIPPLLDHQHRYTQMHAQDREKRIHSPELYAIWNGKPYFLDEAVKNAEKTYDYAFWNDAGSFRGEHTYVAWPDGKRIEEIWEEGSRVNGRKKEDLLFFPMHRAPPPSMRYWQEGMGPVDNEFSEGSFFGGAPQTITWWRNVFYAYHDHYLSQGLFVGKDQTLFNALFLLFPSRIITVWLGDPQTAPVLASLMGKGYLGSCGAEWFYYQFFLAGAEERDEMRHMWDAEAEESGMWDWGWGLGQSCRLTEVLGMEGLLRRRFGDRWRSPGKSVELVG